MSLEVRCPSKDAGFWRKRDELVTGIGALYFCGMVTVNRCTYHMFGSNIYYPLCLLKILSDNQECLVVVSVSVNPSGKQHENICSFGP